MSRSIQSSLFNEDFSSEQQDAFNSEFNGWSPTSRRSSTTLPHPSGIQPSTSSSSSRYADYAFPPIRRNSATGYHSLFEDIASVPMLPEVSEQPFYREQRSMSYSFGGDDNILFNHHHLFLDTIMQEDDEEETEGGGGAPIMEREVDKQRIRSKSSTAIMDIWNPSLKEDDTEKWTMANNISSRRSSLIPPALLEQQQDDSINGIRERMRRFSLAPSESIESPTSFFSSQRRHSLAGPTSIYQPPTPQQQQEGMIAELAVKERYTSPPPAIANTTTPISLATSTVAKKSTTTTTTPTPNIITAAAIAALPPTQPVSNKSDMMKVDDMGKGTRLDSDSLKSAVFYVVEFKGGRSDVFYCASNSVHQQDLVIVEADRGKDLGKVTMENISRQQLEIYYTQLKNNNTSTEGEKKKYLPNEIYVKCIFRQARSDEITLLMAKGQDEAKALMVCQSKIKQKKLHMQVVDAEYQWDRRKLTFYFVAEKRVDFRELVRELFKLYKTRIWMCAVSSIVQLK